jgi:lon-related putative ATP-dependent protease
MTDPSESATRVPTIALCRRCDPNDIPYASTDEAADLVEVVGQDRAAEAARFGVAMKREGYNLFALGPAGLGKRTMLEDLLDREAARIGPRPDCCYVNNFAQPESPRALILPCGMGARLRDDMARAIADMHAGMRAAFESDEYRTRRRQLVERFDERQSHAFSSVQARAKEQRVALARTESGVELAPLRDGQPLGDGQFEELPEAESAELMKAMQRVGADVDAFFAQYREWEREHDAQMNTLSRETAAVVARRTLDPVRTAFRELPRVLAYLSEVETDVARSAAEFLEPSTEGAEPAMRPERDRPFADAPFFRRYVVNVIVDNAGAKGAPVVSEDNPTCANLLGRVEQLFHFGTPVSDLTLIRAGALHRARGGFLLLDATQLLAQPFAWDALKRALKSGEVRTEALAQLAGQASTASLEPEAISLDGAKVVLFGDRDTYYMLAEIDRDFLELFKVMVDFEETIDRGPESHALYARLVATLAHKEKLRPLDRGAVARVIEHAARLAGDAEKLSIRMHTIADLLREADHTASTIVRDKITQEDVQGAIDARARRSGRVREHMLETIRRGSLQVETDGARIGQINGLAVIALGEQVLGIPRRITAQVRVGGGEVLDLEREVDLGGPSHSKGVLILAGFLGGRYAADAPLALSASVVFEQSYDAVEGDSASLAELCALLSALSELPIAQGFGVTGSIDQHGRVQAIGSVNEKIEGFFDACLQRGLTGAQGVVIPKSSLANLMLRRDIVAAAAEDRFHVHAVDSVDEAIALLTGTVAGVRDGGGSFGEGSVNARVEARLRTFAERARRALALPASA